ncbi:MAG: UDP-N-acetylmuramoyl-L-alanyl-D-glutamate--2,6-diaminopimelate ligase [Gemmatimonadaceae bacterium]|nr:UDP-N-acetylmuramoyl-L-alanyl-D-glutamate--2,6-diaminopimelate ligase [Gemmatimonadaceae bacterium]
MRFALRSAVAALDSAGLLAEVRGDLPDFVSGISDDSRHVEPGFLFVAVRGSARDGHDYLDRATQLGATVAMVEDASRTQLPAIVVREGRKAAAVASGAAFGEPSKKLRLISITGTNGKSTTAGILRHLLDKSTGRSASIGTLGVLLGTAGEIIPGGAELTTPGPVELQRVLRVLVDRGVKTVAMEVSSHSLDQRRIDGLMFDAAVFTNLTRDHLDYHGTMEAYYSAKASLLEYLKSDGSAAINADDEEWARLPVTRKKILFGKVQTADVRASGVRFSPSGSEWTVHHGGESFPVQLPLIGDVNVHNALAAIAVCVTLGMDLETLAQCLSVLPQVPGRLEVISSGPTVLRDYAHTPDALERALAAIRRFTAGRLILVFGCGGDRDRGKRPQMGRVAEVGADLAIVTSDNPRTENASQILDDIEAGMQLGKHLRIEDRRIAIERALMEAGSGDVVLLAGKGHETYQIFGTTKTPFDEQLVVSELLSAAGH